MAEVNVKTLQTRISLKYDSYANWMDESKEGQGAKLVLLPGELGICYVGDTNQESNVVPTVLFKVGDGTKTFKELPWASAKAADVYSWAKASDVVYNQTAKTITFVKGNVDGTDKVITFNYVTLAEVQAITNGLDSRITALENSVGANGDIGKSVADHESRLDVIEGTGEGSIKKAEADAKAYTDTRETAITTAYQTYADQAEADAKKDAADKLAAAVETLEATDEALSGRIAALEGTEGAVAQALKDAKEYADQAELDAVASAKEYTDGRETAITAAYEKYADDAAQAAKDYADDEIEKAVNTINAKDEAQDTEIGKKLDKSVYDAYIEGKSMSDEELKTYADGKASAAQSAAEATAAADAAAKVKALKEGEVAANAAAISAMDTAYKAADTEIKGRLDTVEGQLANVTTVMDFVGAGATLPETAQKGDVFVINSGDDAGKEFVYDGTTWVEFGYATANENAIADLKDRMDAAEGDIDGLQTAVTTTLPAADTALGQRIDALVGENGTIATGDAATLASAKSYTDGRETTIRSELKTAYEAYADQAETDAVAAAKSYTDGEIDKLEAADEALEGNVKSLQDIVDGYSTKGSIKADVDTKLATDTFNTWKTTHETDHAKTATEITAEIAAAVKTETDNRVTAVNAVDAKVTALDTRMGTAEGKITTLQGIVETGDNSNANLRSAITDLQTLTGETGAIRTEIADAKKAGTDAAAAVDALAKGQVATNKTDIEDLDGRVTAIEGDYLKQADLFIINCGTSTTVTHTAPRQ